RSHTLNSAPPLLNEAEFVKNPPDHPVPQFGDALPDVLNGQTERQEAGTLDLDAVVKQRQPDRRSLLGVICMNDGVDERLPDRNERNRPTLLPAQPLYD